MWTTAGLVRSFFGVLLEEDLRRPDFTINALALDENGQVIDLSKAWMTWKIRFCGQLGRLLSVLMKMLYASCGASVFKLP